MQQFVQQLGRKRAGRCDTGLASACENPISYARPGRIRKPPVGGSSLPVGSVFSVFTVSSSER